MIYVDNFGIEWRGKQWFHMFTDNDDLTELHEIAKKIGLKRDWFQNKSLPHYDVTENKKKLAILNGVTALNQKEANTMIRGIFVKKRQKIT